MAAIEEIKRTIELEGGLSNDAQDKGGITKYGISKTSYPNVDIVNLTLEGAIQIYLRDYYERLGCHRMSSEKIRWKVFDIGVNCGTNRAAKFLQKVLGTEVDGLIGKETIDACNLANEDATVLALMKEQVAHYARIVVNDPTQSKFLVGWVNRAFSLL